MPWDQELPLEALAGEALCLCCSACVSLGAWGGRFALQAGDVLSEKTMECDQNETKKIGRILTRNCWLFWIFFWGNVRSFVGNWRGWELLS